jgi:hypothetical protein
MFETLVTMTMVNHGLTMAEHGLGRTTACLSHMTWRGSISDAILHSPKAMACNQVDLEVGWTRGPSALDDQDLHVFLASLSAFSRI